MRKHQNCEVSQEYKIMVIDDEEGIVDVVTAMLRRSGYWCQGFTDPYEAMHEIESDHYDLLILDYFMQPIHGDKVVERIRQTNYELYILLLTGHKELAPPINTLKSLDIQAYCEKDDRTDQLQLLVESGIKSIEQMRTIKRFQDGLNSILGAVPKIYQLQPIGNILEEILRQILPLVKGEDAFILIDEFSELLEEGEGGSSLMSSGAEMATASRVDAGAEGEAAPSAAPSAAQVLSVGVAPAAEVREDASGAGTGADSSAAVVRESERKSIFCGIGCYRGSVGTFAGALDHELMEAIGRARSNGQRTFGPEGIILPLCDEHKRSLGVIYVRNVESEAGIELLEIYAHQAASSISNAFLHSLVNIKNEELHGTYAQLKARYMETIEVLRLAVDAKDEYTRGHSDRVADLSVHFGRALGVEGDELEKLRVAGLFHDIGKIGTADDILLKTESLSDSEYDEIKRHPVKGAMILSAVSVFEGIVPAVRHHHERYDGKGYPDGLAGQDIELAARIISVADALDAMTSDRQYRSHLTFENAIDQMRRGSGTQFDPTIVDCALSVIEANPDVCAIINRT